MNITNLTQLLLMFVIASSISTIEISSVYSSSVNSSFHEQSKDVTSENYIPLSESIQEKWTPENITSAQDGPSSDGSEAESIQCNGLTIDTTETNSVTSLNSEDLLCS